MFDLSIFGVDNLLEFGVFIVKGFDLVQVLLLQVFQLRMVTVVEFCFERIDFLLVLRLLIDEITPQPIFFLLQLADLKVSFLVKSNKLHIEVTDLILLLLTVLLDLPDLQLILLIVAEVMPLEVLDLKMVLILELTDLDVLDMLNFRNLFLDPLNFVDQLSVLNVVGGGAVDC